MRHREFKAEFGRFLRAAKFGESRDSPSRAEGLVGVAAESAIGYTTPQVACNHPTKAWLGDATKGHDGQLHAAATTLDRDLHRSHAGTSSH